LESKNWKCSSKCLLSPLIFAYVFFFMFQYESFCCPVLRDAAGSLCRGEWSSKLAVDGGICHKCTKKWRHLPAMGYTNVKREVQRRQLVNGIDKWIQFIGKGMLTQFVSTQELHLTGGHKVSGQNVHAKKAIRNLLLITFFT